MRVLIILFLALLCLYALSVIIAAIAIFIEIFIEEEEIRETVYGEVWDDGK